MLVINDINQLNIKGKTAVAIGKFDGIHIGHQLILDSILTQKKYGYKSLVFTFNPSPTAFFGGGKEQLIITNEEKKAILEKMGIDILIEYPLNKITAAISPESFITEILVNSLNMGYIAAGEDLSFGYGGKGNFELLEKYASEYGFETNKISKVKKNGEIVSSTIIKEALKKGNMKMVTSMMGDSYFIEGKVVGGKRLGRTLGFPTANVYPVEEKILPMYGVYYTKVFAMNNIYNGITNIGIKPTVSEDNTPIVETYLFDFNGDLYNQNIKICFIDYKRPERKFVNLEELKDALINDIQDGNEYFKMNK